MSGLILPLADTGGAAIVTAALHAPYLSRLYNRLGDELVVQGASAMYEASLAACRVCDPEMPAPELMTCLRDAKARAHLAIAALDLSGTDHLSQTTNRITRFADSAVETALQNALAEASLLSGGLFVAALGKMGAIELNYSSDIDMAVFFDPDSFEGGARDPTDAASRVTQQAMRLLNDHTRDGYVFRTDLRLRPDPSSNPLAVSTRRAELYYESVGQNWERMVWIKGRPCAGDLQTGDAFLAMLEPFIWRRHLDYWAIADVQAIKNMINTKVGDQALQDKTADLKLGAGGIREIEFFVQTQQIILGGRNPSLRVRGTLEGLTELVRLGAVEVDTATELSEAYTTLRGVEHRIQMLNDEQTHTLPASEEKRAAVAALCGRSSLDAFDAAIAQTRLRVHEHYASLFADESRRRETAIQGNLVFTGVDDDPATIETLQRLGFSEPSRVIDSIRNWHRGRTPATRTPRGRELLTAMLPGLLASMSETGEADQAFARFARFFEGLSSGVQTLSMLAAEPELLEDLVATLALAPRIGHILSRRPGLLEALLSVSDRKIAPELSSDTDFETAINKVRHWHGEQAFLIGHALLHGRLAARDAARAWTDLADQSVRLMANAAEAETIRRFGPAQGIWNVAALGKLGGGDMTAGSDLDLLVIYDPQDHAEAQTWFTRFTQRLITALSTETAEGQLYEVDMRLRPSGRAGPVATSIAAFERYHRKDAWTWEHMALTRLRPVAGDVDLGQHIKEIADDVIVSHGDSKQRTEDILDMRHRLWREKPPSGAWDLKMREGGLVDLEFIVQHALLATRSAEVIKPKIGEAIEALRDAEVFTDDEGRFLYEGYRYLQALQQVQRLALDADTRPDQVSAGLASRFCRACNASTFEALVQQLELVCDGIKQLRCKKIGPVTTES